MGLNHRSESEVSNVLDKSGLKDTSASRTPFHLVMKLSDDRRKKVSPHPLSVS